MPRIFKQVPTVCVIYGSNIASLFPILYLFLSDYYLILLNNFTVIKNRARSAMPDTCQEEYIKHVTHPCNQWSYTCNAAYLRSRRHKRIKSNIRDIPNSCNSYLMHSRLERL
jgi:hypothetical protein